MTLDENLSYAGSFSEGAGDTFVLSGGHLLLSGAATFAGGTVDGSNILYTEGTTAVSGLTIGGTVEWENTGTVNESGGNVTVGDASGDEAILYNTAKAIYDILDNSGIGLGASTASYIKNAGLFEKTGGTGDEHDRAGRHQYRNDRGQRRHARFRGGGIRDGIGRNLRRFHAGVRLDGRGRPDSFVHWQRRRTRAARPAGFAGEISGFDTVGANDTIEVAGPWVFSGFTENAGGTQGTLAFANGASTLSLTLLGDYNPADFVHQTQANGSTLITYTPNGVWVGFFAAPRFRGRDPRRRIRARLLERQRHDRSRTWAFVVVTEAC